MNVYKWPRLRGRVVTLGGMGLAVVVAVLLPPLPPTTWPMICAALCVGSGVLLWRVQGERDRLREEQSRYHEEQRAQSAALRESLGSAQRELGCQSGTAREEILRAKGLVTGAIGNLVDGFTSLAEQIGQQRDLALNMVRGGDSSTGFNSRFQEFVEQTSATLDAVVAGSVKSGQTSTSMMVRMGGALANAWAISGASWGISTPSPSKPTCWR